MDLKAWNPWQELEQVQAEMAAHLRSVLERLRRVVPGKPIAFLPALDVVETSSGFQLFLALPGMVEEDIDIALEGRVLIVRGEREPPYDPGSVTVHSAQWQHGFFERRVELPADVRAEDIEAEYDAGVLTIRLPKDAGGGEA